MPPRLTRDQRRRALENRLLDAVQRLSHEGVPFGQVTVGRLAATSGIARSTFYFHFPDKSALVRALGERLLTDLAGRSAVLWDDRPPGREALFHAVRGVMLLYRERYAVFAAITETATTDRDVLEVLSRRMDVLSTSLADRLEQSQQLGLTRPVTLPDTAFAFVTLLERTCYNHLRDASDALLDRHADVITTIIWNTLTND